MTKADLVDLVYERVGSSRRRAGEIVEEVFAIIRRSLCRGDRVKISGFGTFVVSSKKARRGRNPRTGEELTIGSRRVLSFKPSQVLKSRVKNGTKAPHEQHQAPSRKTAAQGVKSRPANVRGNP